MAQRFVLPPGQGGERLDRVLARLLPDVSRASVQRWIGEGRVLVGGKSCRARDVVRAGDAIDVEPGERPASSAEPDSAVQFGVLFEDEHLIVVDKPAGLVVHPARGHADGTLVNGLVARPGFERAPADPRDAAGALRPGIVQRIDRDTSGVLVVAKDERTREGLKAQLAAHSVEREYWALTAGVPAAQTISTLHGRHPQSRLRFSTRVRSGKRAVTHVAVLEVLGAGRAALVRCRLETGRTHQIRVHLSEVTRTPILADALYGATLHDGAERHRALVPIAERLGRHALHARTLGFVHPASGEKLLFEAPLPADFEAALGALRRL